MSEENYGPFCNYHEVDKVALSNRLSNKKVDFFLQQTYESHVRLRGAYLKQILTMTKSNDKPYQFFKKLLLNLNVRENTQNRK